jgi:hypothetical protein
MNNDPMACPDGVTDIIEDNDPDFRAAMQQLEAAYADPNDPTTMVNVCALAVQETLAGNPLAAACIGRCALRPGK